MNQEEYGLENYTTYKELISNKTKNYSSLIQTTNNKTYSLVEYFLSS